MAFVPQRVGLMGMLIGAMKELHLGVSFSLSSSNFRKCSSRGEPRGLRLLGRGVERFTLNKHENMQF